MAKERIDTNAHVAHYLLKRNGNFPNSKLEVLIYQKILSLPKQKNKSAEIAQQIFYRNGWSNAWQNGIYDFHHYHSNTHECMAICMGSAAVIIGGPGGKKIFLKQGDVIILPAGTGHRCVSSTADFLCVGAYPHSKNYDLLRGTPEEFKNAIKRIKRIPVPLKDPVLGKEGFLKMYWK